MVDEDTAGRQEAADQGGRPTLSAYRDWETLYGQDTAAGYQGRFRGSTRAWNNRWIWRAVARELRRAGGGPWPHAVVDAPAGTGRFTAGLRQAGVSVLHLDRSPAMLQELRRRHGPGWEVAGDIRRPPLATVAGGVALCLRLMQHLDRASRVEILAGLRLLAPAAVVAYYPGWHLKTLGRRLRRRLGLPHRALRERLTPADLRAETAEAGWQLVRIRRVLPLFSENVLLVLQARP